jgi:phenylacetate-coenzyme A ligase PaaK-like adenylate-forming protein
MDALFRQLEEQLFKIETEADFEKTALQEFNLQALYNPIYKAYLNYLRIAPGSVYCLEQIPCLPITFFRTQKVITGNEEPALFFSSSGTTASETSKHYVARPELYNQSLLKGFQKFFGDPAQYCILALLPSYLERQGSSLVYMADLLMKIGQHPNNGFYLHNLDALAEILNKLEKQNQPTLLIGVSFALLDLAEKYSFKLKNTLIMETGGMKGQRRELTRMELHTQLKNSFGVDHIYSEYGMTELLSQAYSFGEGIYKPVPWMQVRIREAQDPRNYLPNGRTGAINVFDLANLYSCPFIETQDLGKLYDNGSFEVLGRMDASQLRGCNLMIAE